MKYVPAHALSSHDGRYAYASGRIRALELNLLSRQRLDRMAEAGTVDEIVRLLSDTAYAEHLDEVEDDGYEVFLRNEEMRLLDLVDSLSLDRAVSDILRLQYDFQNLKVALREKISERDLGHLYMTLGRFDPEEIKAPVKSESPDLLPETLSTAARGALGAYAKSQDPAEADIIVDKAMFAYFLGVANAYGAPFITGIVKTWIDLANVRTFVRARYMGFESRSLPGIMIEGGLARLSDFYEAFHLSIDEIIQRFEFSPYRRILEVGGAALERESSFAPLEREIDNCITVLLSIARYFTFGLEIVLGYALLRQMEIKALRLILAAKDRGMAPEHIKERIPDGT
jgi:V/A-type H+-transporting ATPase subunit C